MNLSFIPFELLAVPELQQVLTWRNHPSIRLWMNNTQETGFEEHLSFVNSLKTNTRKAAYLVKSEDRGIGVIQLNGVEGKSVNDVGLYVNLAFLKRGMGYRLGFHGAWFLFEELGFDTLRFQANPKNVEALRLWEVLGITDTGNATDFEIRGALKKLDFVKRSRDFKIFMKTTALHESI